MRNNRKTNILIERRRTPQVECDSLALCGPSEKNGHAESNKPMTSKSRAREQGKSRPHRTMSNAAADEFVVVGIGASAGGLEACSKLFDALPADTGMAFVLVQHLDPVHKSMMADLLAGHTSMKVLEAMDGVPIEPDHVYVIPPGQAVTFIVRADLMRFETEAGEHDRTTNCLNVIVQGMEYTGSVVTVVLRLPSGNESAPNPCVPFR